MSWAKVKKINSDLSTPLDVLIKGQKRIGASDNVYAVVSASTVNDPKVLGKFKPKVNGSIRIMAEGYVISGTGSVTAETSTKQYSIHFEEYNTIEKYIDIPVKKNENITIKQSGSYLTTTSIKIGATLIDNTLGEFVAN